MEVIYWPQSFGKTTALVENARKVDGIVIVKSDASKKYIEGKWNDVEVYSVSEFIDGIVEGTGRTLFIDDADELLKSFVEQYSAAKLQGISLTMGRPY